MSDFTITLDGPLSATRLVSLDGVEQLRHASRFSARCILPPGTEPADAAALCGARARLDFAGHLEARRIAGVVERVRVEQRLGSGELSVVLDVRSALARLGHRRTRRIFQACTALGVIEQILEQHGIAHSSHLARRLDRRELCVQYDETDLAFIQRLASEEGMVFFGRPRPRRLLGDRLPGRLGRWLLLDHRRAHSHPAERRAGRRRARPRGAQPPRRPPLRARGHEACPAPSLRPGATAGTEDLRGDLRSQACPLGGGRDGRDAARHHGALRPRRGVARVPVAQRGRDHRGDSRQERRAAGGPAAQGAPRLGDDPVRAPGARSLAQAPPRGRAELRRRVHGRARQPSLPGALRRTARAALRGRRGAGAPRARPAGSPHPAHPLASRWRPPSWSGRLGRRSTPRPAGA
ncbi:MAG: hypothetical protein IPM79_35015 [Polyangiaceae bacterium]|nr:hypothetical protein [Polyangiaceae bacterium]